MKLRTTAMLALVALLAAHPLRAQQPTNPVDTWKAIALRLEPGSSVTIGLKDGGRVTGALIRVADAGVDVKPRTRVPVPLRAVPWAEIASIERQRTAESAPRTDVSAGYLNVSNSMHGWNAQVSAKRTRRMSLVGEVNGSYGSDCGCGDNITYSDVSGLAGVRFGYQQSGRVWPFWQVLGGMLNTTTHDGDGASSYYQAAQSTRRIVVLQPGVGATVMVGPRFGIQTQADFQLGDPEVIGLMPRLAAGVVIRVGR